jgi:hypothetical protein
MGRYRMGTWNMGRCLGLFGNNNPDMNTRIAVYLRDLYSAPGADLATLVMRYLIAQTGEWTARFQKLITDATA